HYSIVKAMAVEKIDTFGSLGNRLYSNDNPLAKGEEWPAEVPSEEPVEGLPVGSGAIDVDKLVKLVDFFAGKGHPIIVVLNYGTTFKGA
ncbi:glutamate decarboxylase, partial [Vibrio vulnificus]